MIFILKESVMNGSVTMDTIITGVEANSFSDAKNRIKAKLELFPTVNIITDTDSDADDVTSEDEFSYALPDGAFPVYGTLECNPLKMFRD